MGLFVRDQHSVTDKPLYQIGLQKSLLIVGLGNPGPEYQLTRHNIGYFCIDEFAAINGFEPWSAKKTLKSHLTIHAIGQNRVILCKPQTFMNNSGEAVLAVQQFYKISASDTIVIHDELDLDYGQIRTRVGGGSAGHNGLKSIIEQGSQQAGRIRIGIHNEIASKADGADFVLAKFSKDEQARLPELSTVVSELINEYIAAGQLPADTRSF